MKKFPRTLLITAHFPPSKGGTQTLYYNICRRLPANKIFVVTPEHQDASDFDATQPFRTYRVGANLEHTNHSVRPSTFESFRRYILNDLPIFISLLKHVVHVVKKEKIELLWCGNLLWAGWITTLLRKFLGIPCVFYVHGEELTTQRSGRFYGRLKWYYLRNADCVIAVSSFTQKILINHKVPKDKIRLISNAVDPNTFHPQARDHNLMKKYKLVGKRVLLTVSRLEKRKGHDQVLRALPYILSKIPNVHYLIIGDGSQESALRHQIKTQGLKHVSFGYANTETELVKHYNLCDIFIMPNRTLSNGDTEGFGIVFLEAAACAKPVIGGRAGGVVDAIEHRKNGFLVDGTNVSEITSSISYLLQQPQRSRVMGMYGRRRVQQEFTYFRVVAQVSDVFYTICYT